MALPTDWSPLCDFSLLGIFTMHLTLLLIDVTKQTIPGYTFLLLFFNYYAAKVALEVATDNYPNLRAKISFLSTRTPMDCNIQDGFVLDEIQEAIDQSNKQQAIDQGRIWDAIKQGQHDQTQEVFAEDDLQAGIEQSKKQQVIEPERIWQAIKRGQQNRRNQDGFAQDDIQAAMEQSQAQAVIEQNRIQAAINQGQHQTRINQDFGATTGHGFNWERVWSMLCDLTTIMAHSRLFQLRAEEHPRKLLHGGTQQQIKGLTAILRGVEKRRDINDAFVLFTEMEPSSKWIKTVEDFLTPRPTSFTELLFACLEQLNASNIDCLENAQVYRDHPSFTHRFIQMKRILEQKDSESRIELLDATQKMVQRASTPQLREDLYLTLTARCNGLQPIDRAIDLVKELTPEALVGARHNMSARLWPVWLAPLLESAEAVLNTAQFDMVMQNTALLLREVQRLTMQNYQQLRERISTADHQVKMIQQQVVRNWRILVATPLWDRSEFTQRLVTDGRMDPEVASDVVESLFLGYLEALETVEHGPYSVPDEVKGLSFLDLIKLNNVIVKQPEMYGLEEQIITLQSATTVRDPPPFSDAEAE